MSAVIFAKRCHRFWRCGANGEATSSLLYWLRALRAKVSAPLEVAWAQGATQPPEVATLETSWSRSSRAPRPNFTLERLSSRTSQLSLVERSCTPTSARQYPLLCC